ncbi:hypothetical protein Goarm_020755, partial [Gossypium armourianum]|nr:hypothetical protein [Gossypium armourianum]
IKKIHLFLLLDCGRQLELVVRRWNGTVCYGSLYIFPSIFLLLGWSFLIDSQLKIVCLLLGFWLIFVAFSVWMLQRDVIIFYLSVVFQGRCGSQFCAFALFIGSWEFGGKS